MNYTKGEWEFGKNLLGTYTVSTDCELIGYIERHYNVALVTAAPSLYEALKNLVDRGLIKDPDGDHYQEVLDALAKVEGVE